MKSGGERLCFLFVTFVKRKYCLVIKHESKFELNSNKHALTLNESSSKPFYERVRFLFTSDAALVRAQSLLELNRDVFFTSFSSSSLRMVTLLKCKYLNNVYPLLWLMRNKSVTLKITEVCREACFCRYGVLVNVCFYCLPLHVRAFPGHSRRLWCICVV